MLDEIEIFPNLAPRDVIDVQGIYIGVYDSHQSRERVLRRRKARARPDEQAILETRTQQERIAHFSVDDLIDRHLLDFRNRSTTVAIRRARRRFWR